MPTETIKGVCCCCARSILDCRPLRRSRHCRTVGLELQAIEPSWRTPDGISWSNHHHHLLIVVCELLRNSGSFSLFCFVLQGVLPTSFLPSPKSELLFQDVAPQSAVSERPGTFCCEKALPQWCCYRLAGGLSNRCALLARSSL